MLMPDQQPQNSNTQWSAAPVIQWLLTEGRLLNVSDALIDQLGKVMLEAGAPLWRLRFSMRTLHPLIAAVTHIWER